MVSCNEASHHCHEHIQTHDKRAWPPSRFRRRGQVRSSQLTIGSWKVIKTIALSDHKTLLLPTTRPPFLQPPKYGTRAHDPPPRARVSLFSSYSLCYYRLSPALTPDRSAPSRCVEYRLSSFSSAVREATVRMEAITSLATPPALE